MLQTYRVDVLHLSQRPICRLVVEQLCLLETLINDRRCHLHQFNADLSVLTNPKHVQVSRKPKRMGTSFAPHR